MDKEDGVHKKMAYYSAVKKNEILPLAATLMDLGSAKCFSGALIVKKKKKKKKKPPAGDKRCGSIPGSGRSTEGGHGNSLQYFCLENPLERGA